MISSCAGFVVTKVRNGLWLDSTWIPRARCGFFRNRSYCAIVLLMVNKKGQWWRMIQGWNRYK